MPVKYALPNRQRVSGVEEATVSMLSLLEVEPLTVRPEIWSPFLKELANDGYEGARDWSCVGVRLALQAHNVDSWSVADMVPGENEKGSVSARVQLKS